MTYLFVIPHGLQAIDAWSGNLSISKQTYDFKFNTIINADARAALEILKNHDELHRINKNVVHSRILENLGENKLRRIVRVKRCLLGYCFRLLFHEEIHEKMFSITTKIIPGRSTFLAGETVWKVKQQQGSRSEISIHGSHTPNFWIPPFIGEIILKQVFLSEMRETTSQIEKMATISKKKIDNP